jgi:hypothetical protein
LIGKVLDLQKAETATLADTLDGLAAATFIVDAAAGIVHANAAGRAMLGDGEIFRAANGRLVATDQQAEQTLADIVATSAGGDAAVGIKGIAVPLKARSGQDYVAHALPLTRERGVGRETLTRQSRRFSFTRPSSTHIHRSNCWLAAFS